MPKEPAIARKLRSMGHQQVRLIVRTEGNPQDHTEEIEKQGLRVGRTFRLIRAVSVEGPASAALGLLDRPWVQRIEEDQEVHTQARPKRGERKR